MREVGAAGTRNLARRSWPSPPAIRARSDGVMAEMGMGIMPRDRRADLGAPVHPSDIISMRASFFGRRLAAAVLAAAVLLVGDAGPRAASKPKPAAKPPRAEDLQVVDCLLPGQ